MNTSQQPEHATRQASRRWWRSGPERAADKAEAKARTARANASRVEAEHARKQLRRGQTGVLSGTLKSLFSTRPVEDLLTIVAACIATGVSAQGMWRFSGDVLGLDGPLRFLLFAFIEVAIITSAVRARRNMRENFSAGIDGIAVWALTCLTAVLSSMDARSLPEAIFRLAAPLVAAWLWERGMAIERHRIRGTGRINWRLTPERLLVRMGLAEVSDRTASEVDTHRRLTRVALAAKRAKALRDRGAPDRKVRSAMAKLDRRLDQAVEHTGLARDERMQWALLDQVTTLFGGASLTTLPDTPTWAYLDHPAITGAAKHREAVQLAEAMREWTSAVQSQRDPEVSAAITSMAAYITGASSTGWAGPVSPTVASPAVGETGDGPAVETGGAGLSSPLAVIRPIADDSRPDHSASDQGRDQEDDSDPDRDRPDEQDNREAEEWVRRRCRGQNGAGRKPTQAEVQERFGFSNGWARNRISAVQSRMTARGYQFESDGTVYAPQKSDTTSNASGDRAEATA